MGGGRTEVLTLKSNVGFSKANNIGYRKAKEYNPQFIIIANNDVIFEQQDFIKQMEIIYQETQFYVYGPDVYVRDGDEHQSPYSDTVPDVRTTQLEVERYQKRLKNIYRAAIFYYINAVMSKLAPPFIKRARKKVIESISEDTFAQKHWRERKERCGLIGACIIVSELFIRKNDSVFFPEVFFYNEENILFYRCIRDYMKIVYDPACQVIHQQSRSVKAEYRNWIKKNQFIYSNFIESRLTYLNMLAEDE